MVRIEFYIITMSYANHDSKDQIFMLADGNGKRWLKRKAGKETK